MMEPGELSAGFAGKTWTAGSALTVEGTKSYRGASGEANIPQTRIYNGTDGSLPSAAGTDNTLTLRLMPEDGFSFVPTRLSFQAARYGTDGGTITASVDAGETHVELVKNAGVNRDGKGLTIASFSEEITGVTATADKPLRVNFAFLGLGKTKEMGLSNIVVEGTLVGAAAQVTKYVLTTQVLPSAEAGSVSRDPDLEQYKEGTSVTLKANKNFGYRFKEWQDAEGAVVATDAETTVTMDGAKTLKAVFEAVPVYRVTTDVTDDADRQLGSVTLSPDDHDGQYEAGTKITATANESKILKFLSWTDGNEGSNASATRELTVNGDMKLVANYEVQDFVAVFDAATTANYAYPTTAGYPFAADVTWDSGRNAKSCVVRVSDGSLCYTQDGGTPVVRNRQGVVLSSINGLYQNGYRSSDIAFQFQFSTKGFTKVTFVADMAAKNMAHKKWKALVSTDGTAYTPLGEPWEMAANVQTPVSLELPTEAVGKDLVFIRFTGEGTELLSDKYPFDKQFDGLDYTSNSECGVGNVFVLGEAEVAADGEAPVVTATVPADKAAGISATGRITISFDERIEAADGAAAAILNGKELTPAWSSRSVSFDYRNLDYGAQYTFTMPANYVQDRSGNKYAEPITIAFTTMQRPKVTKAAYDFVVPDMGSIREAIDAAQARANKNVRFRIFVKRGTHTLPAGASKHYQHTNSSTGDVLHDADHPDPITYVSGGNISFIGEDRDATIVTQTLDNKLEFAGQFGTTNVYDGIGNSEVLQLTGNDYYFQDITVKSGMNDARGRNLAVQDRGTRNIYKNTLLYGYQDTWTSNSNNGLYYFEGGQVRGRTDYLCGKGDAYFNGVELRQLKGGYAAVPSTPASVGWVFKDCIISGDESGVNGNYTLGRPWGSGTPVAVFIDTRMNVTPSAIGWNEMSNGWPKRFAEWNSKNANGSTVDLSGRKTTFGDGHANNPRLTAEEAAEYSDMAKMFGDWQPTLLTEQAPVPTNLTATGTTLTWDDSDYAMLWAICRDGLVVDFTTVPTYTITENGSYSIRAANEMGGLSEPSATIDVGGTDGLTDTRCEASADQPKFNLSGQRVNAGYRGIVVSKGKKVTAK